LRYNSLGQVLTECQKPRPSCRSVSPRYFSGALKFPLDQTSYRLSPAETWMGRPAANPPYRTGPSSTTLNRPVRFRPFRPHRNTDRHNPYHGQPCFVTKRAANRRIAAGNPAPTSVCGSLYDFDVSLNGLKSWFVRAAHGVSGGCRPLTPCAALVARKRRLQLSFLRSAASGGVVNDRAIKPS